MLNFLSLSLLWEENDSLKSELFFLYGKIYTSLDIRIDGLQSTCMHLIFRVSRGPHNFILGLALVELVKNT